MDIEARLNILLLQYGIGDEFPDAREYLEHSCEAWSCESESVINGGNYRLSNGIYDLYHVIFDLRKKLSEEGLSGEDRKKTLEKLIFSYLYIRDFVNADSMLQTYVQSGYDAEGRYREFAGKLEEFFRDIRRTLAGQKDIVNFWLDALDYGTEKDMPYLRRQAEQGVYFENAYTEAPWTGYTLNLILSGRHVLDDLDGRSETVEVSEAALVNELNSFGYDFGYYGFHSYSLSRELCGNGVFSRYQPSTLILWQILREMAKGDEGKKFYLAHIFMETHVPWVCGTMESDSYYPERALNEASIVDYLSHEQILECRRRARVYIDGQLEFYDSLWRDCVRIYMSDHGDGHNWNYPGNKGIEKCHTMLFVCGGGQRTRHLRDFFPYVNYREMVGKLLRREQLNDSICNSYALIQNAPFRSVNVIRASMTKELWDSETFLCSRGIVTEQDSYIRYMDGTEYYYRRDCEMNRIRFSEHAQRIEYLRQLAGNRMPDLRQDCWKTARIAVRVAENHRKRVGGEEPGIRLLRTFVESLPAEQTIAIRGGGNHTIHLLEILGDLCSRIVCIADKGMVGQEIIGIPVISPSQLAEVNPDVVILSSLVYRQEMKEELKAGRWKVYDVYDELERQGIAYEWVAGVSTKGFYEPRYEDSDFEGVLEDI